MNDTACLFEDFQISVNLTNAHLQGSYVKFYIEFNFFVHISGKGDLCLICRHNKIHFAVPNGFYHTIVSKLSYSALIECYPIAKGFFSTYFIYLFSNNNQEQ